ncbi:DUF4112 domain-containing protein [Thermocoleostomius sinensis]|uniref:DUF4112 domain-containing protein n=1 Tax=Thermocoleostomius sinensis A174 TaxID=2016057 RepID=A0A9E9C9V7_9CYAN|nr:DUF4112 domain-containing protein [Thermocoleostomius sinensis]WAL58160.1 DUF4112 domain-containing protein [Thermocoleostomius sinensis A174]
MNTVERLATLNRIRRFTRLMDTAFRVPVLGIRFGLDPIIGLIPGAGDLVSTIFSVYLIVLAARFQLPAKALRSMIFNVAIESTVGTVPLLGDLFDALYKANLRNLSILEQHLQATEPDLEQLDPLNLSSVNTLMQPEGTIASAEVIEANQPTA